MRAIGGGHSATRRQLFGLLRNRRSGLSEIYGELLMTTQDDERFMKLAIYLANKCKPKSSTDPFVGAVITTKDGELIGNARAFRIDASDDPPLVRLLAE